MKHSTFKTLFLVGLLAALQHSDATAGGPIRRNSGSDNRQGFLVRMKENQMDRVEARLTPDQIERRQKFWNVVGAAMSGAGSGLNSAASSLNHTYQPPRTTGSTLPSNTHLQLQQDSFNRNYSTNPDHAPANGW